MPVNTPLYINLYVNMNKIVKSVAAMSGRSMGGSFEPFCGSTIVVNSAMYLLTKSNQDLRIQNPSQSAHIILEILNQFVDELVRCSARRPWDKETGEDAVDFLEFQINTQFSIIKDCLVKACNTMDKKGVKMTSSYCQEEYSTFKQLGENLEKTWSRAKIELGAFGIDIECVEHSSGWDHDTVPVTSFRELVVRNELSKPDNSGHLRRSKDKIFDAINSAKQ